MTRYMTLLAFAAIALVSTGIEASEYTFDVDSKFINIAFESQMDIEDILGTTHALEGFARFDGKSGSFELKVPVASLRTGVEMRDEHLRSAYWLDAEKHPHIVFRGDGVSKKSDGRYEVTGSFSMHGIEKTLTIPVEAREIPAAKAAKLGLGDKGAIRIRASFKVKLSDHGVTVPDVAAGKVNDTWTVKVSLFGKEK